LLFFNWIIDSFLLGVTYLKEGSFTEIEWVESTCNSNIYAISKFYNV